MATGYDIEEFPGHGVARPHWRVKTHGIVVASYAFDDWGSRDAARAAAEKHGEADDWNKCPYCGKQYEHSHEI